MKKVFLCLVLAICLFSTSCTVESVCQHRDADDNSLCDECGESYTDGKDIPDEPTCQHRDADDNSLCDECGESYTDGKDVPDAPGVHVHNYSVKSTDDKFIKTPADKENAAVYYYSCLCGDKGSESFVYGFPIPNYYTVTFNFDNGSENIVASYAENSKLTAITPLKNGYTFVEWQSGGVKWDFETDTVSSDTTLVAIWERSVATLENITYDNSKTAISVNDEITPELFSASCYYSDGTPAVIDVTYSGTVAAGNTVNVRLSVTSDTETKQVTIKNVKVYGAPELTYDESIRWVNVQSGLNKSAFSASATDTFGADAAVTVTVEGEAQPGRELTVVITATDIVGNTTTATIENIRAYAAPTVVYNTTKTYVNITDTIDAALFEASATDSFGKACEITVAADKIKAGAIAIIVITATDEVGNTATETLSEIKVYGTPTVRIDEFIYENTDMSFIAVVKDSFGNELTPEISYTGELADGREVAVTVKATDSVGNKVEKTYKYIVNHDKHNVVDGCCTICEKECPYVVDGNYIYFGEYPQTLKADNVTVTETQDSRGYYLGSDGFYYAKVFANPYESSYTFSTGESVTASETYYFKVEPIRWRILSSDGEVAFVLCDSIIANHRYDEYSNNYGNSEIRQWLNETFYETAFTALQREIILTTAVDNSEKSTGYFWNPYACGDTEDKIFLLSYAEATNNAYGFSSGLEKDAAKAIQTSDYSRAVGVFMSTNSSNYGNGHWWLRSPCDLLYYALNISRGAVRASDRFYGVVPALRIRL